MNNLNKNDSSLVGAVDLLSERLKKEINNCLPVEVVAVNSRKFVDVKPLIKMTDYQGKEYSRPVIKNIPVLNNGSSAFVLTFPIKTGDLGWIIACDRDISDYISDLKESSTPTFRKHNFSDSFFIPDFMSKVNAPDETSAFIMNKSAKSYLKVNDDEVTAIVESSFVTVKKDKISIKDSTTDIELSSSGLTIKSSGNINITAPSVNINGVTFGGAGANQDGQMNAKLIKSDSVVADGIKVENHVHHVKVLGMQYITDPMSDSVTAVPTNKTKVLIDGKPAILEWVE